MRRSLSEIVIGLFSCVSVSHGNLTRVFFLS